MEKTNKELVRVRPKHGTAKKIAKRFGVSIQSVSYSLNGHVNSDLAKKIRKAAVAMGGDAIYN